MNLAEKYRPATWAEFIGHPRAVEVVDRIRATSGLSGRAYWISGPTGVGKTCMARLIAAECAAPLYVTEAVGRTLTIKALRDMQERLWRLWPMEGPGHALIVNEAHGLKAPVIEYLLDVLERLPETLVVIFTTTVDGEGLLFDEQLDCNPLRDRCKLLALTGHRSTGGAYQAAMVTRLREIAQDEGLDGRPESAYRELLVKKCHGSMRRALDAIESGDMLPN